MLVRTLKELRQCVEELSIATSDDEDSVLIVTPGEVFPVALELYLSNSLSSYEELTIEIRGAV